MDCIKVRFSEYGNAAGWFWIGKITVVAKEVAWLSRLSARLLGLRQQEVPIINACRHTLRHEYGHALWWAHEALFRDSPALAIFGHGDCPQDFITEYASTDYHEDFAETFCHYVRRRGVMPAVVKRSDVLWLKWSVIRTIPKLLQQIDEE